MSISPTVLSSSTATSHSLTASSTPRTTRYKSHKDLSFDKVTHLGRTLKTSSEPTTSADCKSVEEIQISPSPTIFSPQQPRIQINQLNNQLIYSCDHGDKKAISSTIKTLKSRAESNPEVDSYTYNILINQCDLPTAKALLRKMSQSNIQPDAQTQQIINQMAKREQKAQRNGLAELNSIVPCTSVDTFEVEKLTKSQCIKAMEIACSTNFHHLVLKIFAKMKSEQMKLGIPVCNYTLFSLINSGAIEKAWDLLVELSKSLNISSLDNGIHKKMLVGLCQRSKYEEALWLYSNLRKSLRKNITRKVQLLVDWLINKNRMEEALTIYEESQKKPIIYFPKENYAILDHQGLFVGFIFLAVKKHFDQLKAHLEIPVNSEPLSHQKISQKEELIDLLKRYLPSIIIQEQDKSTLLLSC